MDVRADRARYEADRAKDLRLSATEGIDAVMKANRLDALLFPSSSSASIAAKPGYPTIVVPFGFIEPGGGGAVAGGGRGTGEGGPGGGRAAAAGTAAPAGSAAGAAGGGRSESGYPAGFTPRPSPYGVSFTGTACSEPRLIEIAFAFEQATQRRVPPKL